MSYEIMLNDYKGKHYNVKYSGKN